SALFRSTGPGVAPALAQVALIALAPGDGGSYRVLDLPATASRQLLVPAALALVFSYLEVPRRSLVAAIACAGLALAFVHATYAIFLLLPLAGFVVARAAFDRRDAVRGLVALCALAWRRRFAAFVAGGTVLVLALLLVPTVFVPFTDAVSVSQARRAAGFVPLAFALAGGAAVLARLAGPLVLPAALGAGI